MKPITLLVVASLFALQSGRASGANTNTINLTNCGVLITCQMPSSNAPYVLGKPMTVAVSVQNLNTSIVRLFETDPQIDMAFIVTAPDGAALVPKAPTSKKIEEFRRKIISLNTKETYESHIRLSDLYDLKEIGQYSIVAKRKVLLAGEKPCEGISDPIVFTVAK